MRRIYLGDLVDGDCMTRAVLEAALEVDDIPAHCAPAVAARQSSESAAKLSIRLSNRVRHLAQAIAGFCFTTMMDD